MHIQPYTRYLNNSLRYCIRLNALHSSLIYTPYTLYTSLYINVYKCVCAQPYTRYLKKLLKISQKTPLKINQALRKPRFSRLRLIQIQKGHSIHLF